jgi:hypothetical protein
LRAVLARQVVLGIGQCLKEKYPETYAITADKDASVNSYLETRNEGGTCSRKGSSVISRIDNWRP